MQELLNQDPKEYLGKRINFAIKPAAGETVELQLVIDGVAETFEVFETPEAPKTLHYHEVYQGAAATYQVTKGANSKVWVSY